MYDIADGRSQTWLTAPFVTGPLWSPRGDRVVTGLWNDSTSVLVVGSPDAATAPDTVMRGSLDKPVPFPASWRSTACCSRSTPGRVRLDLRSRPPKVETLLSDVAFADLSPDGRLLLFSRGAVNGAAITQFPSGSSLWQVPDAVEALWASMTTVRYWGPWSSRGYFSEVTVDSATGRVIGAPRRYLVDPRFNDTPGWSHRTASNGDMIYVQGPARTTATYLRVVPNWVAKMKQAVDSAERAQR